jgi:uncharacterized protein YeaO (DUF488 family)
MRTIRIKRVYEEPAKSDGYRVLVDRIWPRGITKEAAAVDEWQKEIAPSTALRKWFGHDPERWKEFQKQYREELKHNKAVAEFVENHQDKKHLTLVYGAKDEAHTHALVLQQYLEAAYARLK